MKVVTLAPRLIIVNTIGQGLEVQQARVDGNTEVLKVSSSSGIGSVGSVGLR